MHKKFYWTSVIARIALIISWCVLGVKLLNGNYAIKAEAYISLVLAVVSLVYLTGYRFTAGKCPYCGKTEFSNGKFCSHCRNELARPQ